MKESLLRCLVVLAVCWANATSHAQTILSGKIVYVYKGDLYVKVLDTGMVKRLTATKGSELHPSIAADGTKVVFAYLGNQTRDSGIYVMNIDGTARSRLINFGATPAWSPDGAKIAFASGGVWVMNGDGSGLTQLTDHGFFPAWSPDGTKIAFGSDRNSADGDLWVMNADGANAQPLLTLPGDDIDVSWAPSSKLVFSHYQDVKTGYDVYVFDPAAFTLTRVTTNAGGDFWPSWSPDAARVVYEARGKGSTRIMAILPDGTDGVYVADGSDPSWGP